MPSKDDKYKRPKGSVLSDIFFTFHCWNDVLSASYSLNKYQL